MSCQVRTRIWNSTSQEFRAKSIRRLHVNPSLHSRSGLGVIVNAALFLFLSDVESVPDWYIDPGCGSEVSIGLVSNATIINGCSSINFSRLPRTLFRDSCLDPSRFGGFSCHGYQSGNEKGLGNEK